MAVLEIDQLTIDFETFGTRQRVVEGLSLTLHKGEVLALVGESGSGKSVSARAVVGLLPETAEVGGRVRLDGAELLGLPEDQLRRVRGSRIAMVFQEPSTALNPVETVGWQIAEAVRAHSKVSGAQARTRVVELLSMVGIPDPDVRRRHFPHQLSGGQKQRVVIAMALANDPDVLIADEPTTALDVTVQAEILALLRSLSERTGAAVLLITHNMGVVADLADRVAVMRAGSLVEQGPVEEVFAAPASRYTRDLLASVPRLDAESRHPDESADAGEAPVFVTRDLAVEYPGRRGGSAFRALRDVSVAIAPGEVLGVVGESGSGKSTLGRVALGLLRPVEGSAELFGVPLAGVRRRELRDLRRRVGVVYQDPAASLDPLRTVGESIAEPLVLHARGTEAERAAQVRDLLDSVALPQSFADRLPRQLSGGQRQRVALARSLALRPDLLIADEPTSALDVSVQAVIIELLRELQERRGFACLFISHDLAVVNEVADRVAVLREGRLVEAGPAGRVLRTPSDDYTRRLLDSIPVPDPVAQRSRRAASVELRSA